MMSFSCISLLFRPENARNDFFSGMNFFEKYQIDRHFGIDGNDKTNSSVTSQVQTGSKNIVIEYPSLSCD